MLLYTFKKDTQITSSSKSNLERECRHTQKLYLRVKSIVNKLEKIDFINTLESSN